LAPLVMFGRRVFQQTVGIHIGTNCAPLLANLFLYSYEANLIVGGFARKMKQFGDFVDRIYPVELEIKDTIDTGRTDSSLDLRYT